MKLFTSVFLLMLSGAAYAQIKQTTASAKDIPASIKYQGRVINAVRFTDKQGDFMIITTETGLVTVKGDDGFRKAELYAYCYKINGNTQSLFWQMHDFSGDCGEDLKAKYIPGTFAITDLDNNGVAEVWLMYSTACRGDVSPAALKIIMHEGDKKYAVRGTTKMQVGAKEYAGGEYKFDEAFDQAPQKIKQYATQLWVKNVKDIL